MASHWYYTAQGEKQGPVESSRLKQLVSNRTVGPDDLLWQAGMPTWVPARDVKGLFPSLLSVDPSTPPPLPRKAITSEQPPSPVRPNKKWPRSRNNTRIVAASAGGVTLLLLGWMLWGAIRSEHDHGQAVGRVEKFDEAITDGEALPSPSSSKQEVASSNEDALISGSEGPHALPIVQASQEAQHYETAQPKSGGLYDQWQQSGDPRLRRYQQEQQRVAAEKAASEKHFAELKKKDEEAQERREAERQSRVDNVLKVRAGMSPEQVIAILGEPDKNIKGVGGNIIMLNYGENYFTDGTAIAFDESGRVSSVVSRGKVLVDR